VQLQKNSARPKVEDGRGYLDATDDPREIRELWQRWPGPLIGVPTGERSGFDVLDVDPRHDGHIWYAANKDTLPGTRIHRTRSGGRHLFFLHSAGLKSSTSKIAPGIDVRADGGYIIWWPATGLGFRDYPATGVPEWPREIVRRLIEPELPRTRAVQGSTRKQPSCRGFEAVIGKVATAATGERNALLFWGSARAGEAISGGLITQALAASMLKEAALQAGIGDREALATIASGINTGSWVRHG
jgi:hypothetical protein